MMLLMTTASDDDGRLMMTMTVEVWIGTVQGFPKVSLSIRNFFLGKFDKKTDRFLVQQTVK